MKPKTTDGKPEEKTKPNWRDFGIWIAFTVLAVSIGFVLVELQPQKDDPECWECLRDEGPQFVAEKLTAQGYTLYVYGGCHWCEEQLAEFGDTISDLSVYDCGIAHQAYQFENESYADTAYDWLVENGTEMIHVTNLTCNGTFIEYDGYGILGYANKNPVCDALNISGYPTWVAPNGTHIVGYRSLDVIAGWVE